MSGKKSCPAPRARLGGRARRCHIRVMGEGDTRPPPAAVLERWRRAERAAPDEAPPGGAEVGGPEGPEPTRYGDWERKGRCIDF